MKRDKLSAKKRMLKARYLSSLRLDRGIWGERRLQKALSEIKEILESAPPKAKSDRSRFEFALRELNVARQRIASAQEALRRCSAQEETRIESGRTSDALRGRATN